MRAAQEAGCKRVLCDERELLYALGTIDTYAYAKYIAENAPGIGRVAIVTSEKQIPETRFWETVAKNRGLQVKIFADINAAKTWLER